MIKISYKIQINDVRIIQGAINVFQSFVSQKKKPPSKNIEQNKMFYCFKYFTNYYP